MKRLATLLAGALALYLAPALFAADYDHAEAGIFADYFRVHQLGDLDQVGLGGRAGLNLRHNLFGPELEGGTHSAKVFVTLKGGFVNFNFSPEPATFGNFASDIQSLRLNSSNAVLYPGGGIKLFSGPFGFRVDVGDEIYWRDGSHQNLRIAGGPVIRF